jgi:hypothetical protein
VRGSVVKRGKTYSVVLDLGRDSRPGSAARSGTVGFEPRQKQNGPLFDSSVASMTVFTLRRHGKALKRSWQNGFKR